MSDGSAIRLTVSRYFTPIGRSIQKPYSPGDKSGYKAEVSERLTNGELLHGDSAAHNGKQFKTKGGRIVYGGGGISPDVYVPVDTADQLPKANRMAIREQISDASYLYFLAHKAYLTRLKAPADLQAYITADPASFNNYLNRFAQKDSIGFNSLTERQQATVKKNFISSLSRYIWHTEGYIKMRNLYDPLVAKALQELKK